MTDCNDNNCVFNEQAISYLYGEIDAVAKAAFGEHLKTCASCVDEIAAFGAVRASIFRWKDEEFHSLNAPRIEIPKAHSADTESITGVGFKTDSWFDRLGKFFIPSPAWAAAFAFFAVSGGLLLFVYNFSNSNQTAVVGVGNSQTANSSPVIVNKAETVAEKNVFDDERRKSVEKLLKITEPANNRLIAKDSASNKTNAPVAAVSKKEPIIVEKGNSPASERNISASARKFRKLDTVAAGKARIRKLRVPELDAIEDDENEATLRLTDLLDEVGGK